MTGSSAVALVTGASSGIGLAFAHELAKDGHDLVLVARRADRLELLAQEIQSLHVVKVHTLAIDLLEVGAVDRLTGFLDEQRLHVEMLINNAGFGAVGAFHEIARQRQLDMIQLNLTVVTDLTHRLGGPMIDRGRGSIINVASSAAFQPAPIMGVYHATKSYVLFLTEALAEELRGSGVTATAVCPGPVGQTEFGDHLGTKEKVPGLDLVRVPAAKVARSAIDGAARGKAIIVPGFFMRVSSWISPRLPRWLVRKMTHRIQLTRRNPILEE